MPGSIEGPSGWGALRLIGFLLLPLVTVRVLATEPGQPAYDPAMARIESVQIFFLDEVALPAQEAGVLTQVDVKDGQDVAENQLLALVDDRKARLAKTAAELEQTAAIARAEDDIDVSFAIASHEVALSELEKDLGINERSPGAVPDSEIQVKRLSERRARLQIEKSKLDKRVALLTADAHNAAVAAAEETIGRCRIAAGFAGQVIDLLKHKGEWVAIGEPVMRIARMDRLRVDGRLDASLYDANEIEGRPVTVIARLARGRDVEFKGRVVYVSREVQVGNKYRVRAEVENRKEHDEWLLRPGMSASMTVQLKP